MTVIVHKQKAKQINFLEEEGREFQDLVVDLGEKSLSKVLVKIVTYSTLHFMSSLLHFPVSIIFLFH